MIGYILQVVLFQVLFLAVYDFFLKKETFHTYNRWYLLGTPIVSFVLPLIKIPTIQQTVSQEFSVLLPELMLSPQKALEETFLYSESSVNYIQILFWGGVVVFALIFLVKLFKIARLILKNETINTPFYKLVLLPQQTAAFSFFNVIFLGKNIPKEQQEKIIQHELIHSKQKHSLDLLFFEFLRIVMWFNPMIYVYQQKITLLHEYISDSEMVKTTEKQVYFKNLLCEVFQVKNISFVNQFYKHSFIKKRIIMMTKNKSSELKKLKYVLLLPLLASMLVYTSCEVNEVNELQSSKQLQTRYVEMSKGLEVSEGDKETYLDSYLGMGTPEGKEITDKNLSSEEKEEYDVFYEKFSNALPKNKFIDFVKIKLFRKKNGRVTLAIIMTYPRKKTITGKKDDGNNVPFAVIDEVPVFPGCEGTRQQKSDCLSAGIRRHVGREFDIGLANGLGLSPGKKKIWVIFRIDEKGAITEINARAPHPTLKEEAMRAVETLPEMQPGKQDGKAVGMKYTLPISFNIE
ncbi:MAG: M56 family metallopeptidase [Polaribacter sp.]|nr:M56 family metallopeptidase [Polaribacter sp.]